MAMTNGQLVNAAVQAAEATSRGETVSPAVLSGLRAVASTRKQAERHRLAREAERRCSALTEAAIILLRSTIFVLGVP